MSDSPGLVDFANGLVNSVINLPMGKWRFFDEFKLQNNCEINLLIKMFLGLVEMIFGLVNVSFSLPEWQTVRMTFFAPCHVTVLLSLIEKLEVIYGTYSTWAFSKMCIWETEY